MAKPSLSLFLDLHVHLLIHQTYNTAECCNYSVTVSMYISVDITTLYNALCLMIIKKIKLLRISDRCLYKNICGKLIFSI